VEVRARRGAWRSEEVREDGGARGQCGRWRDILVWNWEGEIDAMFLGKE